MKNPAEFEVKIDKLVHGGQGLGLLADGRKCFVWGALPGETVKINLIKVKKDWAEGVTTEVTKPSSERVEPKEPAIFLATSPWQIMDPRAEPKHKQSVLDETFKREAINVSWQAFYQGKLYYGYRNKMEYNFWWDNETSKISLALHTRGSHKKIAVNGSTLASDAINSAGQAMVCYLNENAFQARDLKSAIIRSSQSGEIGISLFITNPAILRDLEKFRHDRTQFEVLYSDPKSPASVATEVLYRRDDMALTDFLLGRQFSYHTRSFFQGNLGPYEVALKDISEHVNGKKLIDLYSGVGSIGLSIVKKDQELTMIETSTEAAQEAKNNIKDDINCQVINASAEESLDLLAGANAIIVDPPRAGLNKKIIQKIKEVKPQKVAYLSCNPSTQARDIKLLLNAGYAIEFAKGYNFFPRTPHIESLLVLKKLI
jgi:23S rRNA (uracil1939-C5)-methyltransferase